ncbi:very-long-chain 3-oxoacyl-CoA reductase-A isoform X5 [Salmo trutta]|uniref:very-long-chain 3-oxoacyl-CoA reductase-A isoform X5 n=1 Tax=Salmo trutta TaxID=8032 RepID=UPI00113195CF|nr:very-long-chain 3-oxoacyl-CoA reductase-A-like isoform X5 [Salmo trutta]
MNSLKVDDMLLMTETLFFWVGTFTVASLSLWVLHRLLQGFRIWVLGNGQLLSPKLGKWAVVTGATDGIGKVYAEKLAGKGFAMMLISRSQDKLDDVARQLEEQYKVETRTIAVDFGLSDIYPKIEAGLAGLEIGVLVNNVGISYPYPEYFLHIPDLDNFITNMINVNMTSVCQMTRLVLPRMVQSCFSIHTKCALRLARTNHMGSLGQWKGPKVWSSTSPLPVACTLSHSSLYTPLPRLLWTSSLVDFRRSTRPRESLSRVCCPSLWPPK